MFDVDSLLENCMRIVNNRSITGTIVFVSTYRKSQGLLSTMLLGRSLDWDSTVKIVNSTKNLQEQWTRLLEDYAYGISRFLAISLSNLGKKNVVTNVKTMSDKYVIFLNVD